MQRLAAAGRNGVLAIPGTAIDVTTVDHVTQPIPDATVAAIFDHKAEYLRTYQADWMPWLADMHRHWKPASDDLLATLKEWWEPLLAMCPALRSGIGDRCLLRAGDLARPHRLPERRGARFAGEDYAFRFDIQRELVETVVAARAVDWSNALFLSCGSGRGAAGLQRIPLQLLQVAVTGAHAPRRGRGRRRLDPLRSDLAGEEIRIGDYIMERLCPHRQADLSVFGEIEDGELVCTLHGWRFDLETGRCFTADDRKLRIRRAES
jgi:UDP-MurNAc hydroxylase